MRAKGHVTIVPLQINNSDLNDSSHVLVATSHFVHLKSTALRLLTLHYIHSNRMIYKLVIVFLCWQMIYQDANKDNKNYGR